MPHLLINTIFIIAIILFWLLVLRIIATLINLDPYHPVTRFLFGFTEYLVKPFRWGPFAKPYKVDLAVVPPLLILLYVIIAAGLNL